MRKFFLIATALVAVCAFSAFAVTSAFAVSFLLAEWLLNGRAITTPDLVEISGELLLEDSGAPVRPDILCSGILVGTVGPGSADEITEVLSLNLEPISRTPLTGLALLCELDVRSGCESSTPTVDVYPIGLPWITEAELFEEESKSFFADLLKSASGRVGWEVTNCLVIGLSQTDECLAPGGEGIAELSLEGTTLLGSFNNAFLELSGFQKANCTQSRTEHTGTAENVPPAAFIVNGGGELSVSSEGAERRIEEA